MLLNREFGSISPRGLLIHHTRPVNASPIWPEESLPIEMDELRRIFGAPHFGLPRNVSEILAHLAAIRET
jgi:hypothetical protein